MGWTFYDSSGRKLNTASTLIDNLDIDGATDIGAAIVDADLFIIDDGAGGTNRKTAASRLKTYAGTTQAVQSDIEAETNQDTYIPPDLMKYHPGVAVAWCQIEADGTLNTTLDYNVASVDDTGTGNRRVNLTNALSHVNSFVVVFGTDIAGGGTRLSRVDTDSIDCLIYNSSDALADGGGFDHFAAFGDFA
jgi:hypothetical protein